MFWIALYFELIENIDNFNNKIEFGQTTLIVNKSEYNIVYYLQS
jgi:hypothetical protein